MAIVEDEALVLRSIRHGETSRIATLLARSEGKIHLIAKGARDPRSPFGAALEPLAQVEVVVYLKKNRSLQFLKAAAILRAHEGALGHPRGYHLAMAGVEFIDRVLTDEDPHPAVYQALLRFLDGCDRRPEHPRGELRLRAFQLHTVALLGYAPRLDGCAACGRPIEARAGFSASEGGVLCRDCGAGVRLLPLSPPAADLLRRALAGAGGASAGEAGAIVRERPPAPPAGLPVERIDREVAAVVEAFLTYHVTGYRGLRSLKSLEAWDALADHAARGGGTP